MMGRRTALPTRYPSRVALGAPTRGDANGRGSPRSAAGAIEQAVSGGRCPRLPHAGSHTGRIGLLDARPHCFAGSSCPLGLSTRAGSSPSAHSGAVRSTHVVPLRSTERCSVPDGKLVTTSRVAQTKQG
jgi:hypothetical protein